MSGSQLPFSIRPEHIRFGDGPLSGHEVEVSGLLHDIQYQGSATRYELKLANGQLLSVSQANNQWLEQAVVLQPGQRLTARWNREAMTALQDTATSEGK
ncbi:TOBE domain protein [compost metagenome]